MERKEVVLSEGSGPQLQGRTKAKSLGESWERVFLILDRFCDVATAGIEGMHGAFD